MQPFQQVEHPPCRRFVQIACRLIGQQQSWFAHQRSRQRYPLLLAAR
jgi:hypothetical protein